MRDPAQPITMKGHPMDTAQDSHDQAKDQREGPVARSIESVTSHLPSDTFLWAAVGSITASLALKLTGRDQASLFVGQWAPTFLILGLYNKLVKVAGHDRLDHGAAQGA
jgi:hypothetical protein